MSPFFIESTEILKKKQNKHPEKIKGVRKIFIESLIECYMSQDAVSLPERGGGVTCHSTTSISVYLKD